jgi:hypothetical protein
LPPSLWLEFSFYFIIPIAALGFFRRMEPLVMTLTLLLLFLMQPFWNLRELGMGFRAYLLAGALAPILLAFMLGLWFPAQGFPLNLPPRFQFFLHSDNHE